VYITCGMGSILAGPTAQKSPLIGTGIGLVMLVGTFFVIFYGVKEFRDNVNGGNISIGEAVKLGALIALIAALLAAAFTLLYHYVIDPGYMDRMMETMRESFEESDMAEEQIDQAMKWSNMFRSPILGAGFTIVWYCLWGFVKGLISGAILKREPTPSV
jgi:amino acid transporter